MPRRLDLCNKQGMLLLCDARLSCSLSRGACLRLCSGGWQLPCLDTSHALMTPQPFSIFSVVWHLVVGKARLGLVQVSLTRPSLPEAALALHPRRRLNAASSSVICPLLLGDVENSHQHLIATTVAPLVVVLALDECADLARLISSSCVFRSWVTTAHSPFGCTTANPDFE